MMDRTANQEIVFGVAGQSLVWDAYEGRPDSIVDVTVYNRHDSEDVTDPEDALDPASIESSPVTTFNAPSGFSQPNNRLCNLTDTTGVVVGRAYLATNAQSQRAWIEAGAFDVASVESYAPVPVDFDSGDSFETTRILMPVKDSWAADDEQLTDKLDPNPGYRVRLSYTVDGFTFVHQLYFDLLRYAKQNRVTVAVMESFFSSWRFLVPTYHQEDNGQRLIDQAYEQVKFDLASSGWSDEMMRNSEVMDELVKHKSVQRLQEEIFYNGAGEAERVDLASRLYNSRLERLITTTNRTDFATDSDGQGRRVLAESIFSK